MLLRGFEPRSSVTVPKRSPRRLNNHCLRSGLPSTKTFHDRIWSTVCPSFSPHFSSGQSSVRVHRLSELQPPRLLRPVFCLTVKRYHKTLLHFHIAVYLFVRLPAPPSIFPIAAPTRSSHTKPKSSSCFRRSGPRSFMLSAKACRVNRCSWRGLVGLAGA